MADHLGKVPGLEVYRTDDSRVVLDFFTGGPAPGPFLTLTVMQWTVLQQLARKIKWPSP